MIEYLENGEAHNETAYRETVQRETVQRENSHRELQNAPRLQENRENTGKKARAQRVQDESRPNGEPRRLAAGEWLRTVMGFSAPFGHDGMPTVWG